MEFIEHIYENPYDGIKILEKAYAEAYKSLKNEKNTNWNYTKLPLRWIYVSDNYFNCNTTN